MQIKRTTYCCLALLLGSSPVPAAAQASTANGNLRGARRQLLGLRDSSSSNNHLPFFARTGVSNEGVIIRTAGPIDFPADRFFEGGDKQQQAMVHEEVVALLPIIESTVQTPAKQQQQQVEYAKDLQLHGSKAKAAAVVGQGQGWRTFEQDPSYGGQHRAMQEEEEERGLIRGEEVTVNPDGSQTVEEYYYPADQEEQEHAKDLQQDLVPRYMTAGHAGPPLVLHGSGALSQLEPGPVLDEQVMSQALKDQQQQMPALPDAARYVNAGHGIMAGAASAVRDALSPELGPVLNDQAISQALKQQQQQAATALGSAGHA